MYKSLISIVMNCHNGDKYLNESVQSIINQEYKNWELIFFDNQSVDKSLNIIKSFKDKRIKIFNSKKKLTLYNARNHAVRLASGNLISFLDTDDHWDKMFLKKLYKSLVFSNSDLAYSNYFVIDEIKNKKYINEKNILPSGQITQSLISNYKIGVIAVLFKKKLFENKKFNDTYEIIGDFDFFIESSLKYRYCAVQEPLAFYRIHHDSTSQKKLLLHKQELKEWINDNKNFYKKNYNLSSLKLYLTKLEIKIFLTKIKNLLDR